MANLKALLGALPLYVRMLLMGLPVKVVMSGSKCASTTGDVIYLPAVPLKASSDTLRLVLVLFARALHEAGHVLYTNFVVWNTYCGTGTAKRVLNVLEDVRCDSAVAKLLKGARKRRADMVQSMMDAGELTQVNPADTPANILGWYMLYRLTADVLGYPCGKLADHAATVMDSVFTTTLRGRLDALMYQVRSATSTADCVTIRDQILEMIKEEEEAARNPPPPQQGQQQPPQPQSQSGQDDDEDDSNAGQPQGQGDDKSESGDGESDSGQPQGQGDDEGSAGDQGDAEASAGDQGDAEASQAPDQGDDKSNGTQDDGANTGQAQGQGTEESSEESNSGQPADGSGSQEQQQAASNMRSVLDDDSMGDDQDIGEKLAKILEQECANANTYNAYDVPEEVVPRKGDATTLVADTRRTTDALRNELDSVIDAKTRSRTSMSEYGTDLSCENLWRLKTGDSSVFTTELLGLKKDTAIQVLVDASGSMTTEDRFELAIRAALALGVAFDNVDGVDISVGAFPIGGNPNQVRVLAQFGESVADCAPRFASVVADGYSTPLERALLWAGMNLLSQDNERKILLVITDGQPDDFEQSREMIQILEAEGVECIGIGIGMQVNHLFPNAHCKITKLNQLSGAVFQAIEEKMFLEAA